MSAADLLGTVIQSNSPEQDAIEILPIVGLFFTVSLSAYLAGIMIRRSWLRHYARAAVLASELIRREFLPYYASMVARIASQPRGDDDLLLLPVPQPPSRARRISTDPGDDLPTSIGGISIRGRGNARVLPEPPASPCSFVVGEAPHSPYSAVPPRGGRPAWRQQVEAFAILETTALLTDTERDGLLRGAAQELRHRIWFLHADHVELLVHGAYESAYREYKEALVHDFVQFLALLRRR